MFLTRLHSHGEARDGLCFIAGHYDPMLRGAKEAGRPEFHGIAHVDNEAPRLRRHICPHVRARLDLQAANVLLKEEREGAIVGMRARSDAARFPFCY